MPSEKALEKAREIVFGKDDPGCCMCGGVDAHQPNCYDNPWARGEMHRALLRLVPAIAAALDAEWDAACEACAAGCAKVGHELDAYACRNFKRGKDDS